MSLGVTMFPFSSPCLSLFLCILQTESLSLLGSAFSLSPQRYPHQEPHLQAGKSHSLKVLTTPSKLIKERIDKAIDGESLRHPNLFSLCLEICKPVCSLLGSKSQKWDWIRGRGKPESSIYTGAISGSVGVGEAKGKATGERTEQ